MVYDQYYSDKTAGSPGSFTIGAPPATNIFQVNTPSGPITANLETGEVFFPQGMNRSDALYEFWKGFSSVYMPNNSFKAEVVRLKKQIRDYEEYAVKETTNKIAEKIQKKYGKEKFIVLKPDDLINFIKGD